MKNFFKRNGRTNRFSEFLSMENMIEAEFGRVEAGRLRMRMSSFRRENFSIIPTDPMAWSFSTSGVL